MSFALRKAMAPEGLLKEPVRIEGVGLHNGKRSALVVQPNEQGEGLYVVNSGSTVRIDPYAVSTADRTTSIVKGGEVVAMTVEHLLCALYALHVRNVTIAFEKGYETPILDGSALGYMEAIEPMLDVVQREINQIEVLQTMRQEAPNDPDRYVELQPSANKVLSIVSTISYQDSPINNQEYAYENRNDGDFRKEIANARTSFPFTIESEERIMETRKRLKGAVFDGEGKNVNVYASWNQDGTRHENEIARHKILDFMGDVKVLNVNFSPNVLILLHRTGHAINNALARRISSALSLHEKS